LFVASTAKQFSSRRGPNTKVQLSLTNRSASIFHSKKEEKSHQHGKTLPDMKKMKKIGVAGEAGSAVKCVRPE
jgi:hypothetical protein